MRRYYAIVMMLALWVGLPLATHAQNARPVYTPDQVQTPQVAGPEGWVKRHISDELNNTPEAKAALEDFHQRKAQGLLPRKGAGVQEDTLGAVRTFRVLNSEGPPTLEDIDFELVAIDEAAQPRFQIWVEPAELNNGNVDQTVLDELINALANQTPAGSVNPNVGIIENVETIFGDPPDIDGDGITDILLLDIRDGFDPQNNPVFLAGFVTAADLSNTGNNRDVLYLDTNPTLTVRGIQEVSQTAGHEYQHLIQFNYDTSEEAFVNEGLSEWGEVALGYQGRSIDYLNDVLRYNTDLFGFNSNDSFDDRQRGAMFFNYIADRFGALEAGTITRQSASGTDGVRDGLIAMQAGISLEDLIYDYHVANFFNDTSVDPLYGYTTPQRQGLRAAPTFRVDGRTATETPTTRARLQEAGVNYLVWEQVTDITLTLSALDNLQDLKAEAFLFANDGSFQGKNTLDLTGGGDSFNGTFSRVVVVLTHLNADASFSDGATANVDYSAQWTTEGEITLVSTTYDSGSAVSGTFFTLGDGADAVMATRFITPLPERATLLDRVFLAPFFVNQFVDGGGNPIGDPNDPRDITLYIWGPGGNGAPGDILFSAEITDSRAFSPVTNLTLNFFEIDLTPFIQDIGALPDTLYVGFGEAGEDDNNLVVGVSSYTTEDISFIGRLSDGAWTALWTIQFQGGDPNDFPVSETVIPIRARFAIPTATANEEAAEVPEEIALSQNFPNPFNPTTSVRYSLPNVAEVRLVVYDILGREIAVLADGVKPPGEHIVQIDAGQWASGVYFYMLETPQQTLTQRMVLVK